MNFTKICNWLGFGNYKFFLSIVRDYDWRTALAGEKIIILVKFYQKVETSHALSLLFLIINILTWANGLFECFEIG